MKDNFGVGGGGDLNELRILRRKNSAACVIAQQYSSATITSLRFHFSQEKRRASFKKKNVI